MTHLTLLFAIPLIASLITFLLPTPSQKTFRHLAVLLSLVPLALLVYHHNTWIGTELRYTWLPALHIDFYLSVDHLSLVFLYLTAILVPISLLAVNTEQLPHPNTFYGLVLLLQGLLIGFFTARDLALFTILWEGMLLPLYFIIALWGGQYRRRAALTFLIYMIAGSALMIAAVLTLYFAAGTLAGSGTFDLDALAKISSATPNATWVCAIFLLAFAVKTPLFPFHAWLPDAYCQAPVAGTFLLSAILSKAGIYGIARIGIGLFPKLMIAWSPVLLILAIAGVLYGAFCAWSQTDYKRLIAYSSLSHVNFILVGLFIWNQTAHEGAILQAFNHGITIAALFLVASWLEERLGSTQIPAIGGLAQFMPHLCWLTLFFVLASVALPGTNNFVGEIMILFGLFGENPYLAAILGLTVIFSVVYMLRWMQLTYFQAPGFFMPSWVDIKAREFAIALPLAVLTLWIGLYPAPVLEEIQPIADIAFITPGEAL